ncbi:MAG: amidohydrolase, partial [Ensifer adhaerens]
MNMIVKDTKVGDAVERSIGAYLDEIVALRHDLHRHPELAFHEHRTSEIVASRLKSWGYEVATGIAGTGVVATLSRGGGARSIGIRADMDALPIEEATGLAHASVNPG